MTQHTHITPKKGWFRWNLRDLWTYRDLIFLFTKKSLTVTYKQTILGPLWLLLNPLISSFVYMVVFGRIAGLGTEGVPAMLFYLTGTAAWNFFSACFSGNSTVFTSNATLFGKIWFPRLTVPIATILIQTGSGCRALGGSKRARGGRRGFRAGRRRAGSRLPGSGLRQSARLRGRDLRCRRDPRRS